MTSNVVAWLESAEGQRWAAKHLSRDPSVYHDLIELVDELAAGQIADHTFTANDSTFRRCKQMLIWRDLTWNPDDPP